MIEKTETSNLVVKVWDSKEGWKTFDYPTITEAEEAICQQRNNYMQELMAEGMKPTTSELTRCVSVKGNDHKSFRLWERTYIPADSGIGTWHCGDPDNAQYIRKRPDGYWKCMEVRGPHPGMNNQYWIQSAVIDLDDYDEDETNDYLACFGYSSREEVEDQYAEFADQVIVECIFECLEDDFDDVVGTQEECEYTVIFRVVCGA